MSWHFSQALVAAYSGASSSGGAPSAQSKSNLELVPSLRLVKMTAASKRFLYGTTFVPLTETHGAGLLMWFLGASRARTSVAPATVTALTVNAPAYGEKWPASLAKFDPATCSWRTPQCSFLEGLDEFSETWPRWGMMRGGVSYPLPTPSGLMAHRALITSESGCGLWERVPTPRASDGAKCSGPHNGRPDTLPSYVKVPRVPTPRKIDGRSATENTTDDCLVRRFEKEGGTNLAEFMQMSQRRLLPPVPRVPTPTATSGGYNQSPSPGAAIRPSLETMAREAGGPLNPTWVEWLMGWPIGWTDLLAPATGKFREWCTSHGISSHPET